MSQKDFQRGNYVKPIQKNKGLGFTQIITHEVRHILGLPHPGQYGDVDHFVDSAMSYFAYSYGFNVFEKDMLRRMHVDKLIMESVKILELLKQYLQVEAVSINTSSRDFTS